MQFANVFSMSVVLGNNPIATVFDIRMDKAKEKARVLVRWVKYQSNWS